MDAWNMLSCAAWVISVWLLLWMLTDAWRISRQYDESVLMSSREGEDSHLTE